MRGHTDTVTGLALNLEGTHVLSNAMDCSGNLFFYVFVFTVVFIRNLNGEQTFV